MSVKIKNILTGETLEAGLDHGLYIYKPSYCGEFHRSGNARFILSWSDVDLEALRCEAREIRGGAREKGLGEYILIDGDNLVLWGKLERPHDGKVSDSGIFILNDWMFGEGLKGTFYSFEPNGQKLIEQNFRANLYNNGISKDGQFAVCQTCDSDNEDGNKLSFFDLGKRNLIWKLTPVGSPLGCDRANNYGFDIEKGILSLFYENGRTYRYGFNGNFLDSQEWEKEQSEKSSMFTVSSPAQSPNGYELFEIAMKEKEELKSQIANLSTYGEFISLMEKALEKGVSEHSQSTIHRELGEAYQKIGTPAEAIHHFEKAISLNPKIGVKKILKTLKGNHRTNELE